ncbi:NADAR family protein [Paenibacillus sp. GCM10027626]|uniref:NADAR family protein n=1 Tax=Paenibacillus sp. GCM10027626 TaxID=3273411 RepID=UPI0036431748
MNNSYDIDNPMAPLWFMYPFISRYSIGWRMGFGEHYKTQFGEWFSALSAEDKNKFRDMFPPPKGWLGWYEKPYVDDDHYDDEGDLLWNQDGMPVYTLARLKEKRRNNENMEYLFFGELQSGSGGPIAEACLSHGWEAEFEMETDAFASIEQYLAAEKARLFDEECYTEEKWANKRYSVALNGNLAKFLQNEKLMHILLQTGDKVLVAVSLHDEIWGIGLAAGEKEINNPLAWRGQNWAGFALMEVRDELKRICQHYSKLKLQELHEQ